MAGHSKWAGIKHKKAIVDAQRGKAFSKVIREITAAARLGGGHPEANPRLRLFVLPPRSPKLNGSVERAQRTHTEEFYEVSDAELTVPALNQALQDWERTYNTVRPHQALGYQTPQEFVQHWQRQQQPKCH